jgi:hypothetical protein
MDQVEQLLADQLGLLTRRQLSAAGVSRAAVTWRLGRSWRLVLPGVVATFTGPLSRRHELVAAALLAGPEAVIGSDTAAAWHGISRARRRGPIVVHVPWRLAARRVGFVDVRRTIRPDAHAFRRGVLLLASPARSVVDAARDRADPDEARALLIEAVQRRLASLQQLTHEVEAGPRRGSAVVRRSLQAVAQGAWSHPEAELLDLCRTSTTLPRVWPNPYLSDQAGRRLPSPDGWIDDVGLALQVQSWAYHGDAAAWDRTVEAATLLGELAVPVLGITPHQLSTDPRGVLRRVETTHAALRRRGHRPDVVMRPREVA